MEDEQLKDVFKKAAEIAGVVPEGLRETAFNRALDSLLGSAKHQTTKSQRKSKKRSGKAIVTNDKNDPVTILLANLDRTKYPKIISSSRVLEKALYLLRAARDNHNIDGLSAPQIAKILTEKFRVRTSRQAVGQALDNAGDKVDRSTTSGNIIFKLMHSGEEYLKSVNEGSNSKKG